MGKCICPKHGSSLHYHVCRHVKEACDSGGPLSDLALPANHLVCRGCLTAEVSELLSCVSSLDESEEGIQRFFDAHHALGLMVGYRPLCTDCLHEKTGLDLRRRPLSTNT
jgi:hypothetical protein